MSMSAFRPIKSINYTCDMHNPTRGRQYRRPCTNFPTTNAASNLDHIPAQSNEFLLKHCRSGYTEVTKCPERRGRSGAPGHDESDLWLQ